MKKENFLSVVLKINISRYARKFIQSNWLNPVQLNLMYHSLQNTFQTILATDAVNSFSIFYYNNIEWTFGSLSSFISAQVNTKLLNSLLIPSYSKNK